jgi:hypothetical protein
MDYGAISYSERVNRTGSAEDKLPLSTKLHPSEMLAEVIEKTRKDFTFSLIRERVGALSSQKARNDITLTFGATYDGTRVQDFFALLF